MVFFHSNVHFPRHVAGFFQRPQLGGSGPDLLVMGCGLVLDMGSGTKYFQTAKLLRRGAVAPGLGWVGAGPWGLEKKADRLLPCLPACLSACLLLRWALHSNGPDCQAAVQHRARAVHRVQRAAPLPVVRAGQAASLPQPPTGP